MGFKLNVLMKHILLITCIVQLIVILVNTFILESSKAFFNLIEILFPLFELLALPKFKPKCDDNISLNTSVLKFLNAKAIMLMYIFYCILGLILYILFSVIEFGIVEIDNEIVSKFINTEPKSTPTYIIYILRIMFYMIGLISSVFVRHMYKKSLEVYQGFS